MKVTDTHLEALRELQSTFDEITKRYGELQFQKIMINDEMEGISVKMRELEHHRNAMVITLQEAYGSTGQVNLQTGEFIPD
jgi:adenine-specific DNA methylase